MQKTIKRVISIVLMVVISTALGGCAPYYIQQSTEPCRQPVAGTFVVASPSLDRPAGTLIFNSISWNNFGDTTPDLYLNPRVYFSAGGNISPEMVTFHDDVTATEWCKHVPNQNYSGGTSHLNWANPQEGSRLRYDGSKWIKVDNGDYPRYYLCHR